MNTKAIRNGLTDEVLKSLYDRYCPENAIVLDPCGGWGGRMLGAYCSDKVKRYDCMDACSETVYGLKHLKMLMDRTVEGKEVNVQYGAYEDSDFENGMYDSDEGDDGNGCDSHVPVLCHAFREVGVESLSEKM